MSGNFTRFPEKTFNISVNIKEIDYTSSAPCTFILILPRGPVPGTHLKPLCSVAYLTGPL